MGRRAPFKACNTIDNAKRQTVLQQKQRQQVLQFVFLSLLAVLNVVVVVASGSEDTAVQDNDIDGTGVGPLTLPYSWLVMGSTLLLAILLSWWIGTATISASSSPTAAASVSRTGGGGVGNSSSTLSSSFATVEAFQSVVQRQIVRPTSDRFLRPWSRSSSLNDDEKVTSDNERNDNKETTNNGNSSTSNNNQAAASAVSSSFDYFFNTNLVTSDLEPPFLAMLDQYDVKPEELTSVVSEPDVTHFCFLIHGHRGLSKDLAYFQTVMQREAAIEKKRNGLIGVIVAEDGHNNDDDGVKSMEKNDNSQNTENNGNTGSCDAIMDSEHFEIQDGISPHNVHGTKKRHDMVIYSSVANEGKTTDGIENGGDRLVEEIRTVIDAEMQKRYPEILRKEAIEDNKESNSASTSRTTNGEDKIHDVTISMLGNSLGGLFARYAIAKLVERHCIKEVRAVEVKDVQKDIFNSVRTKIKKKFLNEEDANENDDDDDVLEEECWILDGKYRLHLNIFCTTATPHLGVSGHTWFRIPRTAEIGVAHAMGNTGRDLFRLNDLLHKMATDPIFLGPLGAFRKRICYANCYGTDFVVPAGTAAFLSENSTYPHHFSDDYILDEHGLVIAALHTPAGVGEDKETEEHSDDLHQMSSSLDRLGWKKVFVDVRKQMPSVEIPKVLRRSSAPGLETSEGGEGNKASATITNKVEQLKKRKIVQSKDVADAVSSSVDNRVALPLGHNMIVAFSRNRVFTYANKAGRPIVDSLAKELVEDIFKWDDIYDGPVLTKSGSSPTLTAHRLQSSSGSPSSSSAKMPRRVSDVAMMDD